MRIMSWSLQVTAVVLKPAWIAIGRRPTKPSAFFHKDRGNAQAINVAPVLVEASGASLPDEFFFDPQSVPKP